MKISFFEVKCNKCGAVFNTPLLSDFSYGDMIEGQEMRIDIGPVCPDCRSNNYHYNSLKMVGKRDIERISFSTFTGLSDDEKNSLIKEYIIQFSKL